MAEPTTTLDKVITLAQHRGSSSPPGTSTEAPAPLGTTAHSASRLKENIKRQWWKTFVQGRGDVVGLDSAVILPTAIWSASGHVGVFSDPLTESLITHKRYRADHLFEKYEEVNGHPPVNGLADIPDPEHPDKVGQWTEIKQFSA